MGQDRHQNGKEEMGMAGLSAATRNKIAEVLDAPHLRQHPFTVKYDDENNESVTITFSARRECQFVINSNHDASVFTTSECPGIHSDGAEIFQRSDVEQCMNAVKEWAERVIDRQKDWILDEFGGVADRSPSY